MIDKKPILFTILLVILLFLAAIVARPLFLIICVILLFVYIYKFTVLTQEGSDTTDLNKDAHTEDIQYAIESCRSDISKLDAEIDNIHKEINDLKTQLSINKTLRPEAIAESRILISRFEEQLALRKVKLSFYKACLQKLEALHNNSQMAKKLAEKQQKLQQLQENQYEEQASHETLKTLMEQEAYYLETIEGLRFQMQHCQSLEEAESLEHTIKGIIEDRRKS